MKKAKNEKTTLHYRPCDSTDCSNEGLFKAPKDRSLKSHYYFCLEHVQEYNKSWNFYAGLSQHEIEQEMDADLVGHRPTWKINDLYSKRIKDSFDLLGHFSYTSKKSKKSNSKAQMTTAFLEAIQTLNLTPPITTESVKKSYKKLAKKYHPDKTGGNKKAEETFKQVSSAYNILIKALKANH